MSFSFLNPLPLLALLLVPLLLALPLIGRGTAARTRPFWLGLIVRALVLTGLILGLAGAQLVLPVNHTTVVFVVDHSDSVPAAEQSRAEEFVRASFQTMRAGDRAAIVVFGENALVERLASEDNALAPLAAIPRTTRTNLAAALRLALALLPDDTNKRIVVLSDGYENAGRAEQLADLTAARGVQVDFVALRTPQGQSESYLDALDAPSTVRQGQIFEIVATIISTAPGDATVRLFGDGKLIATQSASLQAGASRLAFSLKAEEAGFRRYTAELDAPNDTLKQNNTAAAFTFVQGPPRVLVVEQARRDADNLTAALESAKVGVERITPTALPGDLAALANYDAVFLVNVPASALPDGAMRVLPAYVRDLGRGLVMIGGTDAYGAGGYLRTPLEKALPVDMDVRARQNEPNLAIGFVIDKSGSMGECHCNDPNAAPGSYPMVYSGLSKVELAKDAVMQASRALGQADYVGVVLFDANAHWAYKLQPLVDAEVLQQQIGGARPEGGTNISAGLTEAVAALKSVSAKFKHMVLLTDGWSYAGQYDALVAEMKQDHITLSIVAAGEGSATYLQQLAQSAGGRYFAARTMSEVPELFFKETVRATGQYIIEEPFQPLPGSSTPILKGLDVTRLPALRGYNGTTPKATARVSLYTARGDPLLATWQYGLGRAAAWTSDLRGQWATDWVTWTEFNTFAAQLANWVLPLSQDTSLQTAFSSDGEQTTLQVVSTDANGRPRDFLKTEAQIIAPDGTTETLTLNANAPGTYRAALDASTPGIYLAQITQRDAQDNPIANTTTGLAVPFSPEYKFVPPVAGDANMGALPALARATNGRELTDPAQAFTPLPRPATRAQPLWEYLLLAAALLFPLDVAARRLRLSYSDWQQLRARLHLPRTAPRAVHAPRALEGLFAARERANTARPARSVSTPAPVTEKRPANVPSETGSTATSSPHAATPETGEEMTVRLKRARERARKARG